MCTKVRTNKPKNERKIAQEQINQTSDDQLATNCFTWPSHRKRILWKRWKISSRGWWIVRITSLPDSATRLRWFNSSREDDASRPGLNIKCELKLILNRGWDHTRRQITTTRCSHKLQLKVASCRRKNSHTGLQFCLRSYKENKS